MMCWSAVVGFAFSFGIFFPVFMEFFNEDRERTGTICFIVLHHGVTFSILAGQTLRTIQVNSGNTELSSYPDLCSTK